MKWAHRTINRGWWWYGCEQLHGEALEQCIQQRQKAIITLYEDIKANGYNGSPISIYFNKQTGQVHTYDGYHRLSIIEYLGRNYDMNCIVSHHNPDPKLRGDFPLAERLKQLNGGNERLYQPCEDERVKNWAVWRPDSEARLKVVLQGLASGSVLDVGCGSGWFSRQLARRGYNVTSLESNSLRLGVARYLSTIQNLIIEHGSSRWQTFLADKQYDNIIMLSVLHHDMLAAGPEPVWTSLTALRGRCKRFIIEFPLASSSIVWINKVQRNLWNYGLDEFTKRLSDATGMTVRSVVKVHPARPIITLEAP